MDSGLLQVSVVYAPSARAVFERALSLAAGATVGDALQASGVLVLLVEPALAAGDVGVWGQATPLVQPLRDGDRVEVYRPLTVDPKVARRQRFQRQGARGAGLFARKRPGSKAGY